MKLKGKVAVIAGGARDIGREVSIKLAKEGAKVVVNYFNSEIDAQKTKQLIEDVDGECIIVRGDITKWQDVQNLLEESKKAFGSEIHILVNVVGGLLGR